VAFLQQIRTSIASVPIYKWGWQVPLTAKKEHTTKTVNSNERFKNISPYAFLIMTCLPHPPHKSATSICISAQDQNPHLTIPYSTRQSFLGSSEVQLVKTFPAFYRNDRLITVHISLIFTILWKTSSSHTPTYLLKIHFNIILQSMPGYSKLSPFPQRFWPNFVQLIIHKIKSHSSQL
jgi:hypothetical protein